MPKRIVDKLRAVFSVDALGMAMPGARLPERVRKIVKGVTSGRVSRVRAAVVIAVCVAVCGAFTSIVVAKSQPAALAQKSVNVSNGFEVVSIRPSSPAEQNHDIKWEPGRFTATNASVERLVEMAYGLRAEQIEDLPPWATTRGYTIQAVMASDVPKVAPRQNAQVNRQALQLMLADRFQLKLHRTTKVLPVYEIVVAKGGPKMKASSGTASHPDNGSRGPGEYAEPSGAVKFVTSPLPFLAYFLSMRMGTIVLDKTELTDRYDFTLNATDWTLSPTATDSGAESGAPTQTDFSGESILMAMKEQLGLELKAAKEPVTVFVVDHVKRPAPN